LTLGAISEMFTGARAIMDWLAECARIVASENETMKWTTPLGLPITQPYRQQATIAVTTVSQQFSLMKEDSDQNAPVTKSRQRSAFPPNFIHSVDSTHMMMTALRCKDAGLTFAGVHDSFWTHAGTVPIMNMLLREEFVALHTRNDLLGDLLRQLKQQLQHVDFPDLPERGDLKVERVLNSRYFFS
jgi:DNA-directed RNA polymerase